MAGREKGAGGGWRGGEVDRAEVAR
ncbi:hypothetical protein E2C01_102440 [Portunus trituberculatus]|uniref:Uncharacterized protein n=1 Tax=Portunus trituberculatus TaxID=210409 RepID=A0A5B7KML8_PORTR|nr:hypothetical protein [Portunus trituberculatus]